MDRRRFLLTSLAEAATPLTLEGQPASKARRVGVECFRLPLLATPPATEGEMVWQVTRPPLGAFSFTFSELTRL